MDVEALTRDLPPPQQTPTVGPALGAGSIEYVEAQIEALCRGFERLPVAEIVVGYQGLLAVIEHRLDADDIGAEDPRRLMVASGWVWALLGCAHFDAGQVWRAGSCRQALRETAAEVGHAELAGWAWEMCSRFALAEHRFQLALAAAEAGQAVAHSGPVAAWLALHHAKATACLDDRTAARAALHRARQVVEQLPQPHDEDHCFAIDQLRLAGHAATVYLWLGEEEAAEDHAWRVLASTPAPDGPPPHPMLVAEARLTLGVLATGRGDLEQALYHGTTALATERISAPILLARANELHTALRTAGGGEQAARKFAAAMAGIRR